MRYDKSQSVQTMSRIVIIIRCNSMFLFSILTCLYRLFYPINMATGPSPTCSRCRNSRKFWMQLRLIMPRSCSQSKCVKQIILIGDFIFEILHTNSVKPQWYQSSWLKMQQSGLLWIKMNLFANRTNAVTVTVELFFTLLGQSEDISSNNL